MVLCYIEFEHARDISNFPEAQPKCLHIKNSRLGLFIPGQAFCFSHGRKNLSCHQHVAGSPLFGSRDPRCGTGHEEDVRRVDPCGPRAKGFSMGLPCWGYARCWWDWSDVFLVTAVGLVPSNSQAKLSDLEEANPSIFC